MNKPRHTPGPWEVITPEVLEDGSVYPAHIVGGCRKLVVCTFDSWQSDMMAETATDIRSKKANAQFIIKACNCHDDLLAALKLLILSWENIDYHDWQENISIAKKAITKAEAP